MEIDFRCIPQPRCRPVFARLHHQVYKGVWRGSMVAVKTMVLPPRMSGAEKRERMAVMEAAISSSLSHPNIVQVRLGGMGGEIEFGPPHRIFTPDFVQIYAVKGRRRAPPTITPCLISSPLPLPPLTPDIHLHHHANNRQPAAARPRVSSEGTPLEWLANAGPALHSGHCLRTALVPALLAPTSQQPLPSRADAPAPPSGCRKWAAQPF
jgi:hypothetical protein